MIGRDTEVSRFMTILVNRWTNKVALIKGRLMDPLLTIHFWGQTDNRFRIVESQINDCKVQRVFLELLNKYPDVI